MNQPYLYDPQANVLRQRADMNEPLIKDRDLMSIEGKYKWVEDWEAYEEHLASLPAYTPVSGWVPEVGKEYIAGVHFQVKEISSGFETETFISKVSVPIEQKHEVPLCPECSGDGYVTNGEHPSSEDYRDYTCEACMGCGRVKEKEEPRVFSLADMIECWEAGYDRAYNEFTVLPPESKALASLDMKQYFKTKGIDLP